MADKVLSKIIDKYRNFLYLIHRQPSKGVLKAGVPCHVEDPTFDITHGDVIHPCVRFVEEGFEGHQWWMVYTPWYGSNDKLENPRLCFSDAKNNEVPVSWNYYCTIKEEPEYGYNSDPTLLVKDGKLYVFWREVKTPATKRFGCDAATFGCYVQNKTVTYFPQPLLKNPVSNHNTTDCEISPTFIPSDNKSTAYAMHLNITPPFIYKLPPLIGSFIYRHHIFPLLDAIGIYYDINSYGISIWEGNSIEKPFHYYKTLKIKNTSKLHQPWHLDLFHGRKNEKDILFGVIQSSMRYAEICLAWSDDYEQFHLYKKPLISSKSIGLDGIYKSSAVIVGDKFYLFYTAKDHQDKNMNRLFVTSIEWEKLLGLL